MQMDASIIQLFTQCLNSKVKLRWNREMDERESSTQQRELQLGNGCCLLGLETESGPCRSRRGGRAGGRGCRPVRGWGRRQPAGGARPPRGQSRPAPVGGRGSRRGRAATRRRKGRARGTWSTLTRTHGLLQLRQEAHTGASVMDGGLEAAPRMARLGRAPARDLGVAARGGIRAATGGGRCGFFPPFLSAVFGHARGRRAVGVAPRPVSVWWGARGKIASSAKT